MLFNTMDTVDCDTPAAWATSVMVGRRGGLAGGVGVRLGMADVRSQMADGWVPKAGKRRLNGNEVLMKSLRASPDGND